jgi:hypothetical protein
MNPESSIRSADCHPANDLATSPKSGSQPGGAEEIWRSPFIQSSNSEGSADDYSLWSAVVMVRFTSIGYLPVLIEDGAINLDVLEWLKFQQEKLRADSTINGCAIALKRFSDFLRWTRIDQIEKPIVKMFFESLVHGNSALGWKCTRVETSKRYVERLAGFMDFYTLTHGNESPNPFIQQPLTWGAVVAERIRRYKTDPLYHLLSTTKRSKTRKRRLYLPSLRADRGALPNNRRPDKKFLLEDFLKLVEWELNPRNLLI